MNGEKKLPAILFYPGDWRKDPGVQSLDYFTRGVWIEILCIMAECSPRGYLVVGGKAISDEALGRMLGLDAARLTHELTLLLGNGTASRDGRSGAIYSRRMVRDETKRSLDRKHGALGGNPKLKNNPPVNPSDKPLAETQPQPPHYPSSQVKSSQVISDQVIPTHEPEAPPAPVAAAPLAHSPMKAAKRVKAANQITPECREVLDYLQAATGSPRAQNLPGNVGKRLAAGHATVEDCKLVIDWWFARAKAGPAPGGWNAADWFNSDTPFKESTFGTNLQEATRWQLRGCPAITHGSSQKSTAQRVSTDITAKNFGDGL